jgi:hypothetical protein
MPAKSKYAKYDDIILEKYEKLGPQRLGQELGMPCNSVCNRYYALTGLTGRRPKPKPIAVSDRHELLPATITLPRVSLDR